MARGRKRQVTYWTRNGGGYWTTINGVQHELARGPKDEPNGPNYIAAVKKYAALLALDTNKGTDSYRLSALFNQYRQYLAETHPSRLFYFDNYCRIFCQQYGHLSIGELRPFHVEEWLRNQSNWADGSKRLAGTKVQAAINWARKKGYILSNPLAGGVVELPQALYRGREARMSRELGKLLVEMAYSYSPRFGFFLRLLRETGCRPIELRMAEAYHYRDGLLAFPGNPPRGQYRHKTAKTKKDRVIHLRPETAAEVEALIARQGAGRIFLTKQGRAWSGISLVGVWRRLLQRKPVAAYLQQHGIKPETVRPYNFRHAWASEWLDSGRSIKLCADLLGTSVRMLEQCYGHTDSARLHEHYLKFMGEQKVTTTPVPPSSA